LTLVFYISGHGFGHTTRNLEVIRHLQRLQPDCRIVIRSSVPQWFVERSVRGVDVQACETDTGVVQIDSLILDEHATARQAAAFYATFHERSAREAAAIRGLHADVVVGDVPPLAFAAAADANVPSIAFANFTWDWIYEGFPGFDAEAPGVLEIMRGGYANASLALRLPFHGGFAPMLDRAVDVPLVARRSRRGRDATRAILNLGSGKPIVLASFGGHGARLPYADIARQNDLTLLVTDYESATGGGDGWLRRLSGDALAALDLCYEDLVAAADLVVSKPGYGIVSECIANATALLYTSRGHFVENEVLVDRMKEVLRCRFVEQHRLRAGEWRRSIDALLAQPAPVSRMEANGGAIVAAAILSAAGSTIGS